ncbi:guanylate/adenylate cyclase [Legionella moravica]|uniref:Guanylate/adenylate cyclase n=1 Tax=Legionella moravica TaxID=39962 RepID=A0A378JYJ3_9GAMM|nr:MULTISPECIES: response regulator [Legionella]KTD32383.1 guanylate/adenylate cyclase [Legionella moravica]RUR18855.1 response regulator [Legionella sp. km535]STX62478.1 guanylate/adenylate cyclase [Legionella moravica]
MRVLLVDDSKTARTLLSRIFKELGNWEILEASNGEEALSRLNEVGSLDLACIDWNMPVMNGLEFLKIAKKQPNFAETWMMMVTTETEMEHITRAMVSGANEYVMKPFTKEVIIGKLQMMGLAPPLEEL